MRPQAPDGSAWITDLFVQAVAEGSSGRAGAETILAKLTELMFVEVIRSHLEALPESAGGWLAGLRDRHVGEALRLIHSRTRKTGRWTRSPEAPAALVPRWQISSRSS